MSDPLQLTYYEFAKEELEQLDNGMSTNASSLTSTSSDSADDTGQSTPQTQGHHEGDLPVQASSHCSVSFHPVSSHTLCAHCVHVSWIYLAGQLSGVRMCV